MRVKNIFIKETSDNLAVLEKELTNSESLSKGAVEMVIHTMHNIKGTAPMVGFTSLPQIATPVELAFKGVQSKKIEVDGGMVEKTKNAVSVLQKLLQTEEAHTPKSEEEQKVLIDYFNTITG